MGCNSDTCSDLENSSQIFELTTKLPNYGHPNKEPEILPLNYNQMMVLRPELDLCYDDVWDCLTSSVRQQKQEEKDRFMFPWHLAGINKI